MPLIIDRKDGKNWDHLEEANVQSGGRIIGTIQNGVEGAILCILKPDDRESVIATTSLGPEAAAAALMNNTLGTRREIVAELKHGQSHEQTTRTRQDGPKEVLRFSHMEGRLAIGDSIPNIQNRVRGNMLARVLNLPEFLSQTDLPFKLHAPFTEILLLRGEIPLDPDQKQMRAFISNARGICAKYRLNPQEEGGILGMLFQAVTLWGNTQEGPVN